MAFYELRAWVLGGYRRAPRCPGGHGTMHDDTWPDLGCIPDYELDHCGGRGARHFGVRHDGVLVKRTYDQSLMSINYARAAAADFANTRVVFARRWIAQDRATRTRLDQKIKHLVKSLEDDLAIAVQRAQSERAEPPQATYSGQRTHGEVPAGVFSTGPNWTRAGNCLR